MTEQSRRQRAKETSGRAYALAFRAAAVALIVLMFVASPTSPASTR